MTFLLDYIAPTVVGALFAPPVILVVLLVNSTLPHLF